MREVRSTEQQEIPQKHRCLANVSASMFWQLKTETFAQARSSSAPSATAFGEPAQ